MRQGMSLYCSVMLIAGFIALALVAPLLAPYDPDAIALGSRLEAPSHTHWMGTDDLGRDVMSRVIYGTRVSLAVGALVALVSLAAGAVLGAAAGYYGGAIDAVVQRLVEALLCFPLFFLVLTIVAIAGPSMATVILALGLTSWPTEARLVRGEVLRVKATEFALAARATGASDFRLIRQHLLPHAIPPALVSSSFGVATAILSESALSFLGLGIPLPRASWGNILSAAEGNIATGWWLALFPGLAITLAAGAFYFLGDAMRRRLDPRLSRAERRGDGGANGRAPHPVRGD